MITENNNYYIVTGEFTAQPLNSRKSDGWDRAMVESVTDELQVSYNKGFDDGYMQGVQNAL